MLRFVRFYLLVLLLVPGCAFPRRSTPLSEVRSDTSSVQAPEGVMRLRFLSAVIPPRQRGGLEWDDDGTGPDAMVRVYRDDGLVWESEPVEGGLSPELNVGPPENVFLPPDADIRIELWDADAVAGDPIGVWRGRGLPPSALLGADARVMLDSRAVLVMRVERARPRRGLGIALYEQRSDAALVLEVTPRSPAARAGLVAGDRVVAIGDDAVESLGGPGTASALARAGTRRGATLVVERQGRREILRLDGGFTWPAL